MMEILNRITKQMKARNVTQRKLTEQLGIKEQVFWDWKNGRSNSYVKRLPEIAKILDVSIEYLANGTEPAVDPAASDLWERYQSAPEYVKKAVRILLRMIE